MADRPEAPTSPVRPAAGGSKLLVGLMGLNSILLVGVVAVLLVRMPLRPATKPARDGEHASADSSGMTLGPAQAKAGEGAAGGHAGVMLQLPDFIVHLRDADIDRYARLTLNVELGAEKDKEAVTGHMPQIRDAFLAYLSDRGVEELRGSEGMALVKQDLTRKLNELLPAAPVKALYVTDIVVQ